MLVQFLYTVRKFVNSLDKVSGPVCVAILNPYPWVHGYRCFLERGPYLNSVLFSVRLQCLANTVWLLALSRGRALQTATLFSDAANLAGPTRIVWIAEGEGRGPFLRRERT